MPNRDIKESCRTSRSLSRLSHGAERMFWRLTTAADDFGRFDGRAVVLRATCFPLMLDRVKERDIVTWLKECEASDLIRLYEVEGKPYGYFVNWSRYQRVRNKISKFPDPSSGGRVPTVFFQRAIPIEVRRQILARDGACLACGYLGDLTVDHIIPVSMGGDATPSNLQTLCRDCNGAKYTRIMNFLEMDDDARQFAASRRESPHIAASPVVPVVTETTEEAGTPDPCPGACNCTPPSDAFDTFWTHYPRHVNKEAARKAWAKLNPDDGLQRVIFAALDIQRGCLDWVRDDGRFIPHAATWLNGRRWNDEVSSPAAAPTRPQISDAWAGRQGGEVQI